MRKITKDGYLIDKILQADGREAMAAAFIKYLNELPVSEQFTIHLYGVAKGAPYEASGVDSQNTDPHAHE